MPVLMMLARELNALRQIDADATPGSLR